MRGTVGDGATPGTASFGYWVRRRRLALDLTQSALARRVGCSPATVKKIEHDERRPSRTMAERLADSLGIVEPERATFLATATGELSALALRLPTGPQDPTPDAAVPVPPPPAGFVGRERELATLDRHLDAAVAGAARVVFVAGEAGDGKTALLTAFALHAQRRDPSLVCAWGRGTAARGAGDPYLPFREVLLALLGDPVARWPGDDAVAPRTERIAPHVATAIASAAPELVGRLLPPTALDRWAPVAPARPTAGRAGDASRAQLLGGVTTVLRTVARDVPLLLVLDDLQWLDTASAELLFSLTRGLGGSRILVVGAYRPSELREGAGSAAGELLRRTILEVRSTLDDARLDLEVVDAGSSRALCDALVDREPNALGEDFRAGLASRTRGHPLFVVELLRELQARGTLARDPDGRWTQREEVDWDEVPDRITAVIERRLAHVDDAARRLLETAAVQGERFSAEVVAGAAGVDEAVVARALQDLDRETGLVRSVGATGPPGAELTGYRFAHVLFQHHLVQGLPLALRRRLHAAVADELVRRGTEAAPPSPATLAYHYTEAGDAEQAVIHLLRAGDQARLVYATDEATRHYERAVAFLRGAGDDGRLARTLMKLGLTHQAGFDHERAQRAFDEAFSLWSHAAERRPDDRSTTLRMVWREPSSLDPTLGGNDLTAPVTTELFSGLVSFGPDDEVIPDVAERWETSDGGRRLTFHLRDDVRWTDGVPVTADDFVATYRRAIDPATRAPVAASLLDAVVGAPEVRSGDAGPDVLGVRAPDERTLVFELREPSSFFIHNLAYYVLLPTPRHVVERHGDAWADPTNLVGNGPFRLVSWDPGRELVLDRNPRYHGPRAGDVGTVRLDLATPEEEHVGRYLAGELDVLSTWFTPYRFLERGIRQAPTDHRVVEAFITVQVVLPCDRPPFDDGRVRRGLAMAIDRERLAEVVLRRSVRAAGGLVPPGMPGHQADAGHPFDPERAQGLLAEAGLRGSPITISGWREEVLEFVAAAWREVGVPTQVRVRDRAGGSSPDVEPASVAGWWADYPDPDNLLRVAVELVAPGFRDERYWESVRRANTSEDQRERLARFGEAERLLLDEAVVVPLFWEPQHVLAKPWIGSWPTPSVKHPGLWKDVTVGPVPEGPL